MSAARSNVRAFFDLALLACMFAAVTILARQPQPRRCLRSHQARAMQPVFTPDCGASCGDSGVTARLRVVGFVAVHFEACDVWEHEGGTR